MKIPDLHIRTARVYYKSESTETELVRVRRLHCEENMTEFDQIRFKEYWTKTEVIREYRRILFTFGDMELPYVFAAEHPRFNDRAVIRKGVILIRKPHILIPGYGGPEFGEGFEHAQALPHEAVYLFRSMGLPYSHIANKPASQPSIEYGRLQTALDRFRQEMEAREDWETGLIKGVSEGTDISLMRYSVGLMIKSASENVREFFEHIRRQKGEPIRPNERITDEDLRRLFG